MKKTIALLLTIVLLAACVSALAEEPKFVTVNEWLDAKGECGNCFMVVQVLNVLNKKSAGVGFYRLSSTGTIGAHKAYLTYSGATARKYFLFDEETTGVKDVRGQKEDEGCLIYDLQGRRVAQPAKGLYIVNGKKVVIK